MVPCFSHFYIGWARFPISRTFALPDGLGTTTINPRPPFEQRPKISGWPVFLPFFSSPLIGFFLTKETLLLFFPPPPRSLQAHNSVPIRFELTFASTAFVLIFPFPPPHLDTFALMLLPSDVSCFFGLLFVRNTALFFLLRFFFLLYRYFYAFGVSPL